MRKRLLREKDWNEILADRKEQEDSKKTDAPPILKRVPMAVAPPLGACPQAQTSREKTYEESVKTDVMCYAVDKHYMQMYPEEKNLIDMTKDWYELFLVPQGRHYCSGNVYTYWTLVQKVPQIQSGDGEKPDVTTPWIRGVIRVQDVLGEVSLMDKNGKEKVTALIAGLRTEEDSNVIVHYAALPGNTPKPCATFNQSLDVVYEYEDVSLSFDEWTPAEEKREGGILFIGGQRGNNLDADLHWSPTSSGLLLEFRHLPSGYGAIKATCIMLLLKKAYYVYKYHELPMPLGLLHMQTKQSTQPLTTGAVFSYLLSSITIARLRPSNICDGIIWYNLFDFSGRIILTFEYSATGRPENAGTLRILDNYGDLLIKASSINAYAPLEVCIGELIGTVTPDARFMDNEGQEVMHTTETTTTELKDYLYEKNLRPARKYPNFEIRNSQGKKYRLATITAEETTTKIEILSHLSLSNKLRAMMLAFLFKIAIHRHQLWRLPAECRPYKYYTKPTQPKWPAQPKRPGQSGK